MAMAKMTAFFSDVPELWGAMKSRQDGQYPIGDITLKPLTEEESEPCDFSGALRVVQLCTTNTPDYFPAIWVGEDDYEERLDEYPVYVLDLQECAQPFESRGNFRDFMKNALEVFLDTDPEEDVAAEAKAKLEALKGFSEKCTEKGPYTVSIPGQEDDYQRRDGQGARYDADDYSDEDGEEAAAPLQYPAGDSGEEASPPAFPEGAEGGWQPDAEEGDDGALKRKREDGDDGQEAEDGADEE